MARAITIKNLYDSNFETLSFPEPYSRVIGTPERCGFWLIWGREKNGKTFTALKLAELFAKNERVLYVSGEEGCGSDFRDNCKRAGLSHKVQNLNFIEYTPLNILSDKLQKRKSARIVFIDNITVYNSELRGKALNDFRIKHPDKLFVFLAHEKAGEPYTAAAENVKRLAKIIIYIEGMAATFSGRCPGGQLAIDEQKAAIYFGQQILNNN